jgi:hypothetical protein
LGDEARRIAANITKAGVKRTSLWSIQKKDELGRRSAAKFAQEKSPGIPAEA